MHRRDALKSLAAGLALTAVGPGASAQPSTQSYGPLGSVAIGKASEAVVGDDGGTVYVAADTGFATVDVSDPANPTVLAEERDILADREGGPLPGIQDVKVEGDRLVVAGPASGVRGEVIHGFALYDVADPANPELLAVHETDYPIHNCFFTDGVAYLTGNDGRTNPVVMVDVSDDEPEEVGRWSLVDHDDGWQSVNGNLWNLHDVWVQDDTAYLAYWDAGTWLVDVSDPASPEYLGHFAEQSREDLAGLSQEDWMTTFFEPPGNAHYVMPNGDGSVVAVGRETSDHPDTEDAGGPAGIDLWDVSDPANPSKLSTIDPPESEEGGPWTTAHNFDLVGDRLYSSWYGGGVKIHDVSDPASPEELTWWRSPAEASFWTAKLAGDFFVASDAGNRRDGLDAELYTFPDAAGEQANPPELGPITTTPEPVVSPMETTDAPDGSNGGSTTTEPTTTEETTTSSDATESDGQPGFGVLAGLAALGLGAWRRRER